MPVARGAMPLPEIIGFTRSGRPVFPIAGADDAATGTEGDKGGGAGASDDEGAKLLASFKEAGIEDPAKALETIKKLRGYEKGEKIPKAIQTELDALRNKVQEHEKRAKDEETAKLTDAERTAKQLAELQGKLEDANTKAQFRLGKAALKASAAAAGALYPDDIAVLVPASKLVFDADGDITNADELVAELKESRPALFNEKKAGSGDGGPRGSAPGGKAPGMEEALRAAAGH